jgi:actin-related protein
MVGCWLAGGSVLASTKSFNYHWISREEYEAYGVDLILATREG